MQGHVTFKFKPTTIVLLSCTLANFDANIKKINAIAVNIDVGFPSF